LLKMVLLQHSLQYVNIVIHFGYKMGNVLPTDMWTPSIWQSTFRLWHSWTTIHLHGGYNLRWRFSSSGMWCCVIGCVVPDVSKEWRRVPLLEPWEYGTTILCIISNYTLHSVTPQLTKNFSCHNHRPRYFFIGFHLLMKYYNIFIDNAIKSISSNCNLLFQARNILGLNLGNR
jgi:hypothetical protein